MRKIRNAVRVLDELLDRHHYKTIVVFVAISVIYRACIDGRCAGLTNGQLGLERGTTLVLVPLCAVILGHFMTDRTRND